MLLQYFCLDLLSAELGRRSLKHFGGLDGALKGKNIFCGVGECVVDARTWSGHSLPGR